MDGKRRWGAGRRGDKEAGPRRGGEENGVPWFPRCCLLRLKSKDWGLGSEFDLHSDRDSDWNPDWKSEWASDGGRGFVVVVVFRWWAVVMVIAAVVVIRVCWWCS